MIGDTLGILIPPCGGRADDVSIPLASPSNPSCTNPTVESTPAPRARSRSPRASVPISAAVGSYL